LCRAALLIAKLASDLQLNAATVIIQSSRTTGRQIRTISNVSQKCSVQPPRLRTWLGDTEYRHHHHDLLEVIDERFVRNQSTKAREPGDIIQLWWAASLAAPIWSYGRKLVTA
jgi:hypothetical protein